MKKLIHKPHLFFFGLIPLFILLGIFKRNVPIDINISYIYYLINVDFWCYISAVYFGLIGINYFSLYWVKKKPNKWLTLIHIILQILCLLPYIYAVLSANNNENINTSKIIFGSTDLNAILMMSFLLYILSIIIHLINFFTSLFLKRD